MFYVQLTHPLYINCVNLRASFALLKKNYNKFCTPLKNTNYQKMDQLLSKQGKSHSKKYLHFYLL